MRIIFNDKKNGIVKVVPLNQDDLWLLSQVISKGAKVSAKTTRKIKISETKVDKKTYYLELSCEKVEYANGILRISGKNNSDIEEIPKGSYHSFSIELHEEVKIEQKWLKYQLDKLEESTKERTNILMIALDREEVYFAKIEQEGYRLLANFEGDVDKKASGVKGKGNFYKEVASKLKEYDERLKLDKIIIASPAFFKDDFMKQLSDENLKMKIILATCSSVGDSSFDEILKREEVKTALAEERARQEITYVDELFTEIGKEGKYAYGFDDVAERVNAGAVTMLLVTSKLIDEYRQDDKFNAIEQLMQTVENTKGKVTIINSNNDGGKRLDGISGIGAILKYKDYNK